MKKLSLLSLLFVAIACSKKLAPGPAASAREKDPLAVQAVADPVAPLVAKAVTPMSDESVIAHGEVVYKAKCAKCHDLKNTANYTQERWEDILKKMVPNAKLDHSEEEMLRKYIQANAKK